MFFSSPAALLRNVLRLLVPASVAMTIWLYLYPVFLICGFPLPPSSDSCAAPTSPYSAFLETARLHLPSRLNLTTGLSPGSAQRIAPFRLLALGDPQLEGDSSIPDFYTGPFPHLRSITKHALFRTKHDSLRTRTKQIFHDLVDFYFDDIPNTIESVRKRIDLLGNDFYLAHIYRTLHWWTKPTHVTVLGDLLGSQWVDDAEFDTRARRYWTRIVHGGEHVPDELALFPADEYDLAGYLGTPADSAHANDTAWQNRIINVAGNHDIGYAGDLSADRLIRFERAFGKANYELRFELNTSACLSPAANATILDPETNPTSDRLPPELRIVNLNSMVLDTPALSSEIQDDTYSFVNAVIDTASAVEYLGHFTVVLTHVPLYKPEGVCVDAPLFTFHDDGGLKEQNQLSEDASRGFLEGILGMSGDTMAPGNGRGRKGVVLNGHDHEGCDTYHFMNQSLGDTEKIWRSVRWEDAKSAGTVGRPGHPGVREITVRSMMGDFGGNAGLLSAWFDEQAWEWRFEYVTCPLGRQYLWWTVHILDLIVILGLVLVYPVVAAWDPSWPGARKWRGSMKTLIEGKKRTPVPTTPVASNGTAPENKESVEKEAH